jgi:hypothetical protein
MHETVGIGVSEARGEEAHCRMWNAECGMTAGRAEKKHFCDMGICNTGFCDGMHTCANLYLHF